ncbi:chemotaxis protein CheB [Tropicibacter sp. S64]|uniref:chemotaxis protein CheB n=1 Tax=Tropicibacter sp. S64 TaxID=3415122 RepID=UPI003C7CBEAE
MNTQIIGVGASAGGLEALRALVAAIPKTSGFAYVIVQHLSPDHPSLMDRLLQEVSKIPVAVLKAGDRIEPDRIYVSPPAVTVGIRDGLFVTERYERDGQLHMPINAFFKSLAEYAGPDAFGVVLSGTGTDGTTGIRIIKTHGGIVAAQASATARFAGMPDSAIATGLTDFVLPPGQIPQQLQDIAEFRRKTGQSRTADDIVGEIEKHLPTIVAFLVERDLNDFSGYKPGTLARRIHRRMQLRRVKDIGAYVDMLHTEADEPRLLVQDFLIGVTHFFRDPEVFKSIGETVMPAIIGNAETAIRVWVPGCSTGEEVYTLAMLLKEALRRAGKSHVIQVFGTDIDIDALVRARSGRYPRSALENVDPSLIERYFIQKNDELVVIPQLREACVFAPHNLMTDPPYSRIDLISCRNLLIYLTSEAQSAILPRLHYALSPGGFLLLGPSETTAFGANHFTTFDRQHRIFRRNDRVPSSFASAGIRMGAFSAAHLSAMGQVAPAWVASPGVAAASTEALVEQAFLERFADPFFAVSGDGEIVYLSDGIGRFVRPAKGALNATMNRLLMPDLRLATQTLIGQVQETGATAQIKGVSLKVNDQIEYVDIQAAPVAGADTGLILVVLKPVQVSGEATAVSISEADSREIETAWRRMRALEANYARSEQELKSANEELLSMNEELQSSNEELDTSREELQSINEELETINGELVHANNSLSQSLNDLRNLFENANLAILFLDRAHGVRLFTPETEQLFSIKERDIGRPISDLVTSLDYPGLLDDIRTVTTSLEPLVREARQPRTSRIFEVRMRPYRSLDDRLDGCVITFVDITTTRKLLAQQERAGETIKKQLAELSALYQQSPVGLCLFDTELRYTRVNQSLADLNGLPARDHIGHRIEEILPKHMAREQSDLLHEVLTTGVRLSVMYEGRVPGRGEDTVNLQIDHFPVKVDGVIVGVATGVQDHSVEVQLRKEKERALAAIEDSEARFRGLVEDADFTVGIHVGREARCIYANKSFREWQGDLDPIGLTLAERTYGLDCSEVQSLFNACWETGQNQQARFLPARTPNADGSVNLRYFTGQALPYRDQNGKMIGIIATGIEVTEEKVLRDRQEIMLSELRHRVMNLLAVVQAVAVFCAESAVDKDDLLDKLQERLEAIARANEFLSSNTGGGRHLSELVALELDQLEASTRARFSLHGDDPELDNRSASALSLALHELTNNALKYGAFSGKAGTVSVACTHDRKKQQITLVWSEDAGRSTPLAKPEKTGFGTVLLMELVPHQFGTKADMEYRKEGIRYTLAMSVLLHGE